MSSRAASVSAYEQQQWVTTYLVYHTSSLAHCLATCSLQQRSVEVPKTALRGLVQLQHFINHAALQKASWLAKMVGVAV